MSVVVVQLDQLGQFLSLVIPVLRRAATIQSLCVCSGWSRERLDDVKAALGLGSSGPAAGARVFAGAHRAGAMGAADAGEAAIVQRVVGRVMCADVLPYLLGVPVGERIDLY